MQKSRPKGKRISTHRSPARFIARVLPGARPAPFPGFVEPCTPTLKTTVPAGPRWQYEIKHDGYRIQAHLQEGKPTLLTSSGLDWTGRFKSIARSLIDVPANHIILDGEVVVPNGAGIADFSLLQADLSTGSSRRMLYYAFDLLFLDGFDLRQAPLVERRRVLAELLRPQPLGQFVFSAHMEGDGGTIFEHACAMGLEGLVCKLRDQPYRSGNIGGWVKVKCVRRGTFTIVGFVPDRDAISALHLARRDGDELTYVGKVGTGFSRKMAHKLRQLLDAITIKKQAVLIPTRQAKTTWVSPRLQAQIEYRGVSSDGFLRHAAYKGHAA